MNDEIISEVTRISDGKKINNVITLVSIYAIRVLIAFIPITIIEIFKFIIDVFLKILNTSLLSTAANVIYIFFVTVITIISIILTVPFLFGGINYFNNIAKENIDKEKITKYIGMHSLCIKQMWMFTRIAVGTIIGLIFFIVPGIIYFLNRVMAPFILIDNEDISVNEALYESRKLIQNRMLDLVKIYLKFFLPSILIYFLGTYLEFINGLKLVGLLILFCGSIMFLIALSNVFLATAIMYNKINGKRAGAIDVEFREID